MPDETGTLMLIFPLLLGKFPISDIYKVVVVLVVRNDES